VAIRSAGVPLKVAFGIQLLPLLLLLPFAVTVALDGALWQGAHAVRAFAGPLRAAESLLRAVVAMLCTSSLVLTTSLSDLAWLLLRVGVPRALVDALLVTHRFFLSMSAVLQTLTNAQRARGGFVGWKGRVRSAGAIGGALLGHTLDRALAVERGLFARGGVPIPRWFSEPWSPRVCAALLAVAAIVMLAPEGGW
jgi:cobalt/nickel transport system permease protein